jgi:hypothetical protein
VIIIGANDMSGLNGLLTIFKREASEASKITFIGSPGLCTPFSEFLSFGVNDKETHFIPLLDLDDCHQFELRSYGMALKEEVSDPHDSDIVVLLGGLAMPDFNVDVNDLIDLVNDILKKDGKIIGVCFMNMFADFGWLEKIDFDCIIDGTLIPMIQK